MLIVKINRRYFADFVQRNKQFLKKINTYNHKIKQFQRSSDVSQQEANKFVSKLSKEEVASRIVNQARYDKQFKDYISEFNRKHSGQVSLLDFSNYATSFGELKDGPIKKSDLDVLQQFQKRKIDQRIHLLRKQKLMAQSKRRRRSGDPFLNHPQDPQGHPYTDLHPFTHPENKSSTIFEQGQWQETAFPPEEAQTGIKYQQLKQGPFYIKDDFVMLLLHRGVSTKVTTLNRLNYYRTLVFMGNGNGIISYGRGRSDTPQGSLQKAIRNCKSNIIAIPMDPKCTLPKAINKRFQDYRLYLRPIPGFNSWGHPTMSAMLALAGFQHMAFSTIHTSKNVYDLNNVFFKAVTTNTTPQQMAEQEGFKVYRHQFVRPLTEQVTHGPLSR